MKTLDALLIGLLVAAFVFIAFFLIASGMPKQTPAGAVDGRGWGFLPR